MCLFKNKIPNVSDLVKITDYDSKIKDTEGKYLDISDYNKFTNDTLDVKIKEKQLLNKCNISGFINSSDLINKIATLAAKEELKAEQDKIVF